MLCIISHSAFAQGDINDNTPIFYRNELSSSAAIQTNGFAFSCRYAKRQDAFQKNIFEFQATSIHHAREVKSKAIIGGKLIYGKLNNIYTFNISTGKQKEKFSKLDKGSVAIRYIFQAGPSIAIEKPYYYRADATGIKYDLFKTSASIYGKAPFYIGLNELTLTLGVYASYSINFEYSNKYQIFRAFEFGSSIQAYPKRLQIMDIETNSWFYPSLFIVYRIGKILED